MKIEKEKWLLSIQERADKMLLSHLLDQYQKYQQYEQASSSNFLDGRQISLIQSLFLKWKIPFQVSAPHSLCERKIVSFGEEREWISVVQILCSLPIEHKDILGSLCSLGIELDQIGDIFVEQEKYYVTCLTSRVDMLLSQWTMIGRQEISLQIVEKLYLEEEHLEAFSLIVPSLRLDVIVSKLSHVSRGDALKLLLHHLVLVNYQEMKNPSFQLKEHDILSIRKVGKFQIGSIVGKTKKENQVIEIKKYK